MAFGISSNIADQIQQALRSPTQNAAPGGISDLPLQPPAPVSPTPLAPPAPAPVYGTQGIGGDLISKFIESNLSRPDLIAQKAQEFGISSADIQAATGYTPQQQASYFEKAGMLPTPSAYGYDLFPELGGSQEKKLERLVNTLALGQELTPGQANQLTKLGAKTGYDFFNVPTYKSLEEQLLERTGADFNAITSYIGQNIDDPTKIYQRATELGITPEEVLLAYSATQPKGRSPYSLEQIQNYFETGKGGFEKRFGDISTSTLTTDLDKLTKLEGTLDYLSNTTNLPSELQSLSGSLLDKIAKTEKGFDTGSLTNVLSSKDFANLSIEEIQNRLANSKANKIEEAFRIQNLAKNFYGLSDKDATQLAFDLYQGKETDSKAKEFYDELLKTGLTKDLQNKFLMDAATRAPESKFFQDNPEALTFYKPIGNIVASPKDSGQYGYYKDAPILSASEADKLLGDKTYVGGNNYFGYGKGTERDDSLGWDLRSKYAGAIANGAGVFGAKATQKQMDEFSKIQEQIDKLGGVQTVTSDEGSTATGVYVPYTDPESGATGRRFVPVESLFATSVTEEGGSNGAENYKLYQDTMAALDRGADQLKIDKSAFATPSELFKAVNDKADNLYIVTGRANNWDKDVADRAGITGVGKDRGGINHATVLYQKVGDKLMPLETLKTFNFDDPNTTRGVIGDIAGGVASILSLPPIQLALAFAGGLPNVLANMAGYTGGASALASTLGSSILGETASAASKQLLGNVLLNAGTSGLMTGLATGDLEQAGKAFLSAGAGTGIAGLSAPYVQNLLGEFVNDPKLLSQLTKVGSETLGGAASSALSGRDIGDYLRNRLFSTGIGALMGTAGSEAKSKLNVSDDTVNMIKAFAPIVTSRRVTPDDIVRIARALEKSNIGQA